MLRTQALKQLLVVVSRLLFGVCAAWIVLALWYSHGEAGTLVLYGPPLAFCGIIYLIARIARA